MSADVMVRFFWVVALMRLRLGESHGPKEWEPPARRTPRVACGSWVLDSRLVDAADPVILVNLSSHERYARYWSIVDAGASNASSERFVVARNGANRGAGVRPYSQLWSGCGATLGCAGAPGRSPPPGPESGNAARNLAVWRAGDGRGVFGVGGEAGAAGDEDGRGAAKDGASLMYASTAEALVERGWSRVVSKAIGATERGCVDEYFRGGCRFDAKFSVVPAFRGQLLLLYARANLNPRGGGRGVQMTSTDRRSLEGRVERGAAVRGPDWAPFRRVTFAGAWDPSTTNVYLFAANANPVAPDTILALFTLVVDDAPPFVALAASEDGFTFSKPHPVLETEAHFNGRALDQPVDGLIREGDAVYFYVHVNVQGIAGTARHGYPPHLARFTLRAEALLAWTASALQGLR